MSAPFTTRLRRRPDELRLGTAGEPTIAFRVQVPEVWDTVAMRAPADTPVAVVKARALEVLMPEVAGDPGATVVKLGGWEVLDEQGSLAAAGLRAGGILLVTARRRRPVR